MTKVSEFLEKMYEEPSQELENEMLEEIIMKANFLSYINRPDNGNTDVFSINMLLTDDKKLYLPIFTDIEELAKWGIPEEMDTIELNFDNYSEIILDQNNKPVYDPVVVGTYNFHTYDGLKNPIDLVSHTKDMELWEKYGTGPNDPTTREEREQIGGAMLGISINFYYNEIKDELKVRNKNKVSFNELQEIINNINEKKLRKIINIIKK